MTISTHYEEAKRRVNIVHMAISLTQHPQIAVAQLAELESALKDMLYHVQVKRQHLQHGQQALAKAGVK